MRSVQRTQSEWAAMDVSVDGGALRVWRAGEGPGVVVVGGALRTARDYRRFAEALVPGHEVFVLERRGRPGSAPLAQSHDVALEVSDLVAVQDATRTRFVFGHSFGGLVVLETLARHPMRFEGAAVYEPGVSVDGAISTSWIPRYLELLAAGSRRKAFAWFIQASGQAPAVTAALPLWYLTVVLSFVLRGRRWRDMDALLEASAIEHRLVAERGELPLTRFSPITARLLLLGGARSPMWMTHRPFSALATVVPHAQLELVPKAGHLAPDDEAPETIARRCQAFFAGLGRQFA